MENLEKKHPCGIETLFAVRMLLDDMIEQLQQAAPAPRAAELSLICSADKLLAGAGETVNLAGVVQNTSGFAAEGLALNFTLPQGFQPLPGSLSCTADGFAVDEGGITIPTLAPGASCIVRLQAAPRRLPGKNPVRVGFSCRQGGRTARAESLSIWVTDRSCCRGSVGCCMADALAQWSLAQLFGLDDCEIALLLEYLQQHRAELFLAAARD